MSWFDAAGLTSLAKSALKEAQRTIDKALDIEENEENILPSSTLSVTTTTTITTTTSTTTAKGLQEKLKDESDNFFASFGLDKKKSPLTPANTPVESSGGSLAAKDGGKRSGSSHMAGSLWGSFTGSFFENEAGKQPPLNESVAPSSSEKVIVATQPPRSSASLPSLQLASSPVSTQPRTASLEECPTQPKVTSQTDDQKESESQKAAEGGGNAGDQEEAEWGWGWESSIMVMSTTHQQHMDAGFNTIQGEFEAREDSLVDDAIDEEGFAKSRLVVGSVEGDGGGFTRQGSQGSLSGKSVDLDVPVAISEDAFHEEQQQTMCLPQNPQAEALNSEESSNTCDFISTVEGCEKRTTVSCANSEVNTPDSIVVLTSESSSPDGDAQGSSTLTTGRTRQATSYILGKTVSPISSPDSIEVLGSSSLLTSPSSIEVLSGVSSSDSSPSHQDSCSNTLIQDLSPTMNVVNTQPTVQKKVNGDAQTWPQPSPEQRPFHQEVMPSAERTPGQESDTNSLKPAVVKQPSSRESETLCSIVVDSDKPHPDSAPGTNSNSLSLQENTDLNKDDSASDSIPSTSTFIAHVVEESNIPVKTAEPLVAVADFHIPKFVREPTVVQEPEPVEAPHPGQADVVTTDEQQTNTHTGSGSVDVVPGEEGDATIPATSLDVSVESGGSSDTITASIDSSQMTWSASRGGEPEQQTDSDMQESSTSGSGGSVVRCLLEEAMGDEEAVSEASSPPEREHSPSSSERSEALKVGSGHTSGHSSGDEVETTTSSDIEVISSPSLDGSTIVRGSTAASRVWASAQRGLRSFLNDRSESPASDSSGNHKKIGNEKVETVPSSMTTSFTSISESEGEVYNFGPGSLTLDSAHITQVLLQGQSLYEKGHRRNQSNFSETSESSSENHSSEVDKLLKKIAQLTEVLEARETKVLELSQVNAALQDTNLRLKTRVEDLEGGSGAEATESLREEFTQRLVTMERKFQQALREKETTKKLLEEARADAATRLSSAEVARDQEERDTVIRELREEGEKLSKQQLNYSNIIKKLRGKEKENETTIKTQKDKLEEQSRELERLRKQLSAKEEVERRQIDAVCQLNATNQRLDQAVKDLSAENAELEGKMTALKSALDTAYKEMVELKREAATKDAEAQEQALSAEVAARKQLEATLMEVQEQARREEEALMAQVRELQDTVTQSESHANRKERQLRADISELQQRVSETEARAEELSGAVSAATRPLLRQMENLQSTHSTQQASWESLEASLTQRLNDTMTAAAASAEKERATREQYAELAASFAALQTQAANLRSENAKLSTELNIVTTKHDSLLESRTKETTQIEALKTSFAEEIGEVKRERDSLEQQLEMEKTAVTAEKKKTSALQEQLKDRERKLLQMATGPTESRISTPRSSPTPSLSRLSVSGSLSESFTGSQWGEEVFESGWSRGTSLYDSMRTNSTATVDALTSQLRQREGEVHHLHSEVTRYETQRESLAQELVSITSQMESLHAQVQDYEMLKDQYGDMEQKYNALLQMYGEKVEEVEELRLDLADVKEMYKAQIDQLLKK